MAYLASERSLLRRADPRKILPECRSILVLGVSYPASVFPAEPRETFRGKVAAYAWGRDYHEALTVRLEALAAFIQAQVDFPLPYRCYTDTGPLLERDLAQRAGLGWIGKNTCLIHPRLGSYFFLAEILLGVSLELDAPFTVDRCGRCPRCIEACPTGCILPDRTLDARRCLSYLTIELKGAIPSELRPRLGEWVFGCDICQQVCPWNQRFAPSHAEPAFEAIADRRQPDLVAALALDGAAFKRSFKGSPVERARRRGYLRNAAVALGNLASGSGEPSAVQALANALKNDPEPLVRRHAAWALGRVGGWLALEALRQALAVETDAETRSEILEALHPLEGIA